MIKLFKNLFKKTPEPREYSFDLEKIEDAHKLLKSTVAETRLLANSIAAKLEFKQDSISAVTSSLNYASDGVILMNNKGGIIFANDMFLTLHKIKDHGLVIGKNISEFRSVNSDPLTEDEMWTSIKKNRIWEGDLVNSDSTHKDVRLHIKVLPLMNGAPEPIFYICTHKEIK